MNITKPFSSTLALYKNAYSGLSQSTWLLSAVMLVNRSGTMVLPFMTIYLTAMGFSLFQAGIVVGLFGAGAICGGYLGGKFTDTWGFHCIQLFTLSGGGLLFIVLGLMKSYSLICLFTFILSLVNDAFRPANNTAIAHYSKEENRTRSYSLNRLAINLGWAIGGTLGGFIASFNYHLLFWIDGITNLVAAFLLHYLLKSKPVGEQQIKVKTDRPLVRSPFQDRQYLLFIFFVILYATCFFQLFSTLPVFYKNRLQLSEFFIGMLMGLNGIIIVVVEMLVIFRLETKNKMMLFISTGVLLTALSYVIFNLLPHHPLTAVISVILVTFGEMFAMPFMNTFWTSRSVPENRGQYAGLYTMAWSLAQVAGPIGGTWIAGHYGFNILWWVTGGVCLITCILFRTFKG
ncbi:MAG: MFS transporter [Bacteroidota bacterium]|nr:MFS transporter [Bacteroidota bacterium]